MPRGRGERCYGFLSTDGAWALCSREELAGGLQPNAAGVYPHSLNGVCGCGAPHGRDDPRLRRRQGASMKSVTRPPSRGRETGRKRYDAVDATGRVVATHVRTEFEPSAADTKRPKQFRWERDGEPGLGGLRVVDLPLYNLPALLKADPRVRVVVTEGEKACDALTGRGILAVGSMTGAGHTPSVASLRPLLGHPAVLWPDADDQGRWHMENLGERLIEMGHSGLQMLDWPDAPPKGDAADFRGSTDEVHALIAAASPWTPRPVGVLLSEIERERVEWLWPGRIPLGKLTVLDGDPGLGKSTLALAIASRVTTGAVFPDGARCPTGGVVILTAEDGLADTVRPRLDAAGADLSRVRALPFSADGASAPVLPDDIPTLGGAIRQMNASLVIVDPLMAYLPPTVNTFRDQDVRVALAPLVALAERAKCAILVIRHLNKREGGPAIYRGGGSIGISAAARSILLVACDPDDRERRVLASVKGNLCAPAPSLAFRLVAADGEAVRIEWCGTSPLDADRLLAGRPGGPTGEALTDAEAFLADILAEGPQPAEAVKAAARDAGIAARTLRRAQESLGVVTTKVGYAPSVWMWELSAHAEDGQDNAKVAMPADGHLRSDVGHLRAPEGQPGAVLDSETVEWRA